MASCQRVAMAFGSSLALFPHYQALGRSNRLSLSFDNLMMWVVIQNMGTALFSLVAGPIADRRGNRIGIDLGRTRAANACPATPDGFSRASHTRAPLGSQPSHP